MCRHYFPTFKKNWGGEKEKASVRKTAVKEGGGGYSDACRERKSPELELPTVSFLLLLLSFPTTFEKKFPLKFVQEDDGGGGGGKRSRRLLFSGGGRWLAENSCVLFSGKWEIYIPIFIYKAFPITTGVIIEISFFRYIFGGVPPFPFPERK